MYLFVGSRLVVELIGRDEILANRQERKSALKLRHPIMKPSGPD
jgi:hypothetical protein